LDYKKYVEMKQDICGWSYLDFEGGKACKKKLMAAKSLPRDNKLRINLKGHSHRFR
jgi:hypothetical protein